jgi:hypothetical protein
VTIFAQLARLIHPPRVVKVTSRPRWFAVGRRLADVICWGACEDGSVVGLVADRRGGLRPARGWRWQGYLPGSPHSTSDVQRDPPEVRFPAADLTEALGDPVDFRSPQARLEIYERLRSAAVESDWSRQAFIAYASDPGLFLSRYLDRLVEHLRSAELDDGAHTFFDALIPSNQDARTRAKTGRLGDSS